MDDIKTNSAIAPTLSQARVAKSTATRFGLALSPQLRVFAAFFLYAFSLGGIFPRLGEIQRGMGVAEGALGLALIGTAAGTLLSLTFASRLLARIGYRRTLLALIPLIAVFFAIASWASGPLLLFCCLLPAGLCIGMVEVVVNVEADRVEHQLGRRIMNRAHAFWSFGFFAAGLMGAGISQLGVSPQLHLLAMVPLVVLATLLLLGGFSPAPLRGAGGEAGQAPAGESPHFARPTWAIMALVCVTFSAMLLEGAGADWSAIYMRDVFAASPLWCGLAVAAGALMQALTRFFADGLVERFSSVAFARSLLVVLGCGALLVVLAPAQGWALLGLGLMGVGTSSIFPLAMSAAAQRIDRPAAVNVAALAQISFVVFLLGPPLLGLVAEHWGVRWSFGVCLPFVLLSLAVAGSLAKRA
ncbi:MFS transporter [Rhodoferax ferrireducens]|uniref:MFS transporter n=1 Tax=Rhodoferax ferrireducens TaxID=192843 RepID=UPI000E0D2EF7|nr:MFS transporter [Rhodoferax ferrireducens]